MDLSGFTPDGSTPLSLSGSTPLSLRGSTPLSLSGSTPLSLRGSTPLSLSGLTPLSSPRLSTEERTQLSTDESLQHEPDRTRYLAKLRKRKERSSSTASSRGCSFPQPSTECQGPSTELHPGPSTELHPGPSTELHPGSSTASLHGSLQHEPDRTRYLAKLRKRKERSSSTEMVSLFVYVLLQRSSTTLFRRNNRI